MIPSLAWAGPRPDPELDDADLIADVLEQHSLHLEELSRVLALARGLAAVDEAPPGRRAAAAALADDLASLLGELWRHHEGEARVFAQPGRDPERLADSLFRLAAEHEFVRRRLETLEALLADPLLDPQPDLVACLERFKGEARDVLRLEERVVFPRLAGACAGAGREKAPRIST